MAKLDQEPPFTREVMQPALDRVQREVGPLFKPAGAYYVCGLIGRKVRDPEAPRGCIFGHNVADDLAVAVVMATLLALQCERPLARGAFANAVLNPLAREVGKRTRRVLNRATFDFVFVIGANDPMPEAADTPSVVIGSTFPHVDQDMLILTHYLQQRRRDLDRYDRTVQVRGRV